MAWRLLPKEQDEANKNALYLLGFGFFEAWAISSLGNWRGIGEVLSVAGTEAFSWACCQSLLLSALIALFALFHRRLGRLFSPIPLAIATVLAVAVTLALGSGHVLGASEWGRSTSPAAEQAVLSFVAQVLYKFLLLAWFRAFAAFDIELILKNCLSVLFCTALFTGILALLPPIAESALRTALAGLQLACLVRMNRDMPLSLNDGMPSSRVTIAVVLGISLVFCTLFRLLGSAPNLGNGDPMLATFCNVFYAELGAVLLLLAGCALVANFINRRRASRSFSFLPFLVPAVLFLAWGAISLSSEPAAVFSVRAIGQTSFDLVSIILFLLIGYQLSQSAFQLFAWNEAVFTAAYLLTSLIVGAMAATSDEMFSTAMLNVLILSAQSMAAFFAVMGVIIARNGLSDSLATIAHALERRSGKEEPQRTASVDDPGQEDAACDTACSAQGSNAEDTKRAFPSTTAPGAEKDADGSRESVISQLAQQYGLSERETSVMALFIKGRSMKRAAEELYLSVGTVSTYAKRIYAKMGIHTRQALIDKFEDAREKAHAASHSGSPS